MSTTEHTLPRDLMTDVLTTLVKAADRHYNVFEPNNQSDEYRRLKRLGSRFAMFADLTRHALLQVNDQHTPVQVMAGGLTTTQVERYATDSATMVGLEFDKLDESTCSALMLATMIGSRAGAEHALTMALLKPRQKLPPGTVAGHDWQDEAAEVLDVQSRIMGAGIDQVGDPELQRGLRKAGRTLTNVAIAALTALALRDADLSDDEA